MSTTGTDSTIVEMRDRLRRVETKLTEYLNSIGFDTRSTKPKWVTLGGQFGGYVEVPGLNASIADMLDVIPAGCRDDVNVYCKERAVLTVRTRR